MRKHFLNTLSGFTIAYVDAKDRAIVPFWSILNSFAVCRLWLPEEFLTKEQKKQKESLKNGLSSVHRSLLIITLDYQVNFGHCRAWPFPVRIFQTISSVGLSRGLRLVRRIHWFSQIFSLSFRLKLLWLGRDHNLTKFLRLTRLR